jgi:hypothetical protein
MIRGVTKPTGGALATGGRAAVGGLTGYDMAHDPNVAPEDRTWGDTLRDVGGAVGGAAYGAAMPRMGPLGQSMGRRAVAGTALGNIASMPLEMAGQHELAANAPRLGGFAGVGSTLLPGAHPGNLSPWAQKAAPWADKALSLKGQAITQGAPLALMGTGSYLQNRATSGVNTALTDATLRATGGEVSDPTQLEPWLNAKMEDAGKRIGEGTRTAVVQGTADMLGVTPEQVPATMQTLVAAAKAGKDVTGFMAQIEPILDKVLGTFGMNTEGMNFWSKVGIVGGGAVLAGGALMGSAPMAAIGAGGMAAGALPQMGGFKPPASPAPDTAAPAAAAPATNTTGSVGPMGGFQQPAGAAPNMGNELARQQQQQYATEARMRGRPTLGGFENANPSGNYSNESLEGSDNLMAQV